MHRKPPCPAFPNPTAARRAWTALASTALALAMTLGVAPARAQGLDNYQHTRWSQENGGPPEIKAMAQTTDGWLWLATVDGLFRFDGIAFERYTLPGPYMPTRSRAISVQAGANGDLYIAYFGQGLVVLHADGRSEDLTAAAEAPPSAILAMAVDDDGSVWAFGATIHHFKDGHWHELEHGPGWVGSIQYSALLDQNGRLWAANENGVWRLDRARGRFEQIASAGGSLAQAPGGDVWLMADKGQAIRLAQAGDGARRDRHVNAATSRFGGIFDADGNLWGVDCPERLCRIRAGAHRDAARLDFRRDATDRIAAAAILPGQDASMLLEDREGDIWLAGSAGLERFRAKRVLGAGLDRGGNAYLVASDAAGQVWAADRVAGTLWRLNPGRAPEQDPARDVAMLATDRNGALLVGGKRSIERRARGGSEQIALPPGPDGKPVDMHIIGILDDGKVLWTATPETGLIGWTGEKWLPKKAFSLPDYIYLVAKGAPGQLWLATKNGELALYDNGRMTHYDARAVGLGSGIFPGETLAMGGDLGFAILKDGRFQALHARDPAALRNVSGLLVGADGDRWLNGAAGIVHVRADDWRRAMAQPGEPLRYELIDALDGYPGQAAIDTRLPSAVTADGRHMWFLGTGGVVSLDSAALRRNTVPPEPTIRSVTSAAGALPLAPSLRIAPGFQQLRFDFTASALRNPERVRFQYRLDGLDRDWQEAGSRRMTLYTNVDPGHYLFRVRAVNEDGVASRKDAVVRLEVEPTLIQSLPFRLACVLLLAGLATMLYRYRVRYLTSRLMERVVVRTAERERIARMLHDTILQTVQALMLRLGAIATRLPPQDRMRAEIETVLEHASLAITEGRDQVHELRASEQRTVENIAAECIAGLRELHPGLAMELRADGASRAVHPGVADEAGNIVCEALRNACAHAGASRIVVAINRGRRALTISVHDNGRGLDEQVARDGFRSGHWGMIGMRERAGRIGARLTISGAAAGGTVVTLVVGAGRAYAKV